MGKAIGIDLGTTNSVVAFKDTVVRTIRVGVDNKELCRSCVALDNNNNFVVGDSAYKGWKRYSPNIVVSVKRLMGTAFRDEQVQKMRNDKQSYPYGIVKPSNGTDDAVSVLLRGKEYTPERISAEILKSLKNDATDKLGEVTHAVITVPAYFTEKQKNATKKAAEMAGLRVQKLIAEPTAAAISYGFTDLQKDDSRNLLVYDFGGGTFDLSILQIIDGKIFENGSSGDRWLGGDDIDRKLIEYVYSEVEKRDGIVIPDLLDEKTDRERAAFTAEFRGNIETAKKNLGRNSSANIDLSMYLETEEGDPVDDVTITKEKYEQLVRPIINRTIQLIDDLLAKTGMPIDIIDNILLVGGSSCIPLIKSMLSDKYGAEKILSSEKPMLAVAEGAAILAQSLPCDDTTLDDSFDNSEEFNSGVCITSKHAYFIQTIDHDGRNVMEKIIDSQEFLPFEVSRQFRTSIANQKIVEVNLFTDAENNSYEKLTSGFFTISDNLPKGSALNFTFHLDADEILTSDVMVVDLGRKRDICLARGYADSSCYGEISKSIDEILSNNNISDNKKSNFLEKIQEIVEKIATNSYSSDSPELSQIEEQVKIAKSIALMNENNEDNKLGLIFATVLLQNFSEYLSDLDRELLDKKINKLNSTNDLLEKSSIIQELESIANGYSLLLHVFMFRILALQSDDPLVAGRANTVYDEMIQALQNKNIPHVRCLINDNEDLLQENATGVDFGVGLGMN